MSFCRDVCGVFSVLIFILIIVALMVSPSRMFRLPVTFDTHQRRDEFFTTESTHPDSYYLGSFDAPNPHLVTDMISSVVNHSILACTHPSEYVCPIGSNVHTIRELSNEHNTRKIQQIRTEDIAKTTFVQKCTSFHVTHVRDENTFFKRLVSSSLFLKQNELFALSLKMEILLARLFTFGTKAVVEFTRDSLASPAIFLIKRPSTRLTSGYNCAPDGAPDSIHIQCMNREKKIFQHFVTRLEFHYPKLVANMIDTTIELGAIYAFEKQLLETNGHTEYISLDDYIASTPSTTNTFAKLFLSWISLPPSSTVMIDKTFLSQLDIDKKNQHLLRTYIGYMTLYHLMIHFRVSGFGLPWTLISPTSPTLSPEILCIRQYEQLFPLHVCALIKKHMTMNLWTVRSLFDTIRTRYITALRDRSIKMGLSSALVTDFITPKLKKMELIVDRCWFYTNNRVERDHLVKREQKILTAINQHANVVTSNYEEVLFRFFTDEDVAVHSIMLYRNSYIDKSYRNLDETFLSWNGVYSRELNAIVLSSGFIHFAMTQLEDNGIIQKAFLSGVIAHEMGHEIHGTIVEYRDKIESQDEWDKVFKSVWSIYNGNTDKGDADVSDQQWRELFADWIGDQIAFSVFLDSKPTPTNQDKLGFLVTLMKLWCTGKYRGPNALDDLKRINIPASVGMLGRNWKMLMNCPS
jgi:hypothetical protein